MPVAAFVCSASEVQPIEAFAADAPFFGVQLFDVTSELDENNRELAERLLSASGISLARPEEIDGIHLLSGFADWHKLPDSRADANEFAKGWARKTIRRLVQDPESQALCIVKTPINTSDGIDYLTPFLLRLANYKDLSSVTW